MTEGRVNRAQLDLGHATIFPREPIIAGSFVTTVLTYTAGHPIDDSGYVKIAFRYASDFGTPQFADPTAPNYCTVLTDGDCLVEPRWDPKGHTRPWGRALFLKIRGGFLDRGEKITIVFGDKTQGSPGWRMQTFCVGWFEFKTLVDPIATYQFRELPTSPGLKIIPGDPVRAVCVAPSQVTVNQKFTYYLKLEDRWGNPVQIPTKMTHDGWDTIGVRYLNAEDENTSLSAISNPIEVLEESALLTPFWADFHGQSEETIGSNSIEDYFEFARDYGLLDIAAHQGNDFQVTDEFWDKINQTNSQFYDPDCFVTFPGYEWSGNTPLGGDRNIYFVDEGGVITRSSTELLPDSFSVHKDSPTAATLFDNLDQQDGPQPFAFAHIGGRYADLSVHHPTIELAVEVHSAWGTFEWLVDDALQRGYRIGICANSDGHKGRPGASYPGASKFGSLGGLTCVLARQLDRQAVYDALAARHLYATTGNRPLLAVNLVTGDSHRAIMGDIVEIGRETPHLHVRAVGTGPIESIEVRNGLQTIDTLRPYGKQDLGRRIKVTWSGAEVRGRDRMVRWDGSLKVDGNAIKEAAAVNVWNANQPLLVGRQNLKWKSVTTGGVAGAIITLEEANAGTIEIDTLQRQVACQIASIAREPREWACGGLQKKIRIYRLPDQQRSWEYTFDLPLTRLHDGDNPIYIRMTQEDGHMAWSSPIYLIKRVVDN